MKQIWVIGIGAGHPEQLTLEAVRRLNEADVLFVPTKGAEKAELAEVRREICRRHVTRSGSRTVEFALPRRVTEGRSYRQSVDDWHEAIASVYEGLFHEELGEGQTGAFLVWGDPGLYDSTIRILERIAARGSVAFDYGVVPGITSLQALTARHRIPFNRIGESVLVTTGRRLAQVWPKGPGSVAVMLDGQQAFLEIEDDGEAQIFWGAYLGTEQEITVSGRLREVAGEIARLRAEARERNGWIMDVYLLRRDEEAED